MENTSTFPPVLSIDLPPLTNIGEFSLSATLAALACFSIAGSRAGQQASGPGSFQVALLDALYALTPDDLSSLSQLETLHAV